MSRNKKFVSLLQPTVYCMEVCDETSFVYLMQNMIMIMNDEQYKNKYQ
jgi:hypothetical protein